MVPEESNEERSRRQEARIAELERSLQERKDFIRIINLRRYIGYVLGVAGMLALLAIGKLSFVSLHDMARPPFSGLPTSLVWAIAVGHALITVALVFFCYQLIRAAERLILPYWWIEGSPETARLMLGVTDPVSSAMKLTEQMVDTAGKIAGAAKQLK